MKDLIFITAYCQTEEQEKVLEKCVDSVLQCEKHVALISHSHIPIHIQKKCQYYVYDYNNEISDDYNLLGHLSFQFDDKIIHSRFFNKTFYGFAIYRMFSIASQIAINFGYDNIHHIEYDCELLDKDLINEHSKLLEEYNSVICTDNGKEDGFLFGSFKSFKVSSLPEYFKSYNKEFIESEIRKLEPKQLEYLTKKIFIQRKGKTRGITNQEEVAHHYRKTGWAVVELEELSLAEQITLFHHAEEIVGEHGAAFTNLIWCRPGCRVMELCADNFLNGCYEGISLCLGLQHSFKLHRAGSKNEIFIEIAEL